MIQIQNEMYYTLVTGASSGIGYELALLFAKNGHNLILVARQKSKILNLAAELKKKYTVDIAVISIDLSQANCAVEIFRQVQLKALHVNYLVNNAGFYIKGAFSETSWEKEQELIYLQCLNHTHLIKLFLPAILKQGKGGILNVCSTGSFTPGPFNAIYCAAKSFMLSFSEALAEEVAGSGVTITALCPGGTKTSFQDFSNRKRSFFNPIMDASIVAKAGFHALMKGKNVVIPGISNKIQVFIIRFLPRFLVRKLAGKFIEQKHK